MTPAEHLEQLHIFATYMLGTRDEALAAIGEVLDQHPRDPASWLRALVAPFMLKKKTHRVDRFGELDEILRTHSTIPVDLSHPLVRGDVRRLNVLLAELKRTCLLTTLRGLTVERRELRLALSGPAGSNTVLALEVDGKSYPAVVKEMQRHPIKRTGVRPHAISSGLVDALDKDQDGRPAGPLGVALAMVGADQ